MEQICKDAIDLMEKHLIPACAEGDSEGKVFYLKLKGDYWRYLAEFHKDEKRQKDCDAGMAAYSEAKTISAALAKTNPLRLGLALNTAVFYYEILQDKEKAIALAQEAFDEAVDEMDNLSEAEYKDSSSILQLLRDNLAQWQKAE